MFLSWYNKTLTKNQCDGQKHLASEKEPKQEFSAGTEVKATEGTLLTGLLSMPSLITLFSHSTHFLIHLPRSATPSGLGSLIHIKDMLTSQFNGGTSLVKVPFYRNL